MKNYRLFHLRSKHGMRSILIDQDEHIVFENSRADTRWRKPTVYPGHCGLSKAFLERTPPYKEYDKLEDFIAENFGDFL